MSVSSVDSDDTNQTNLSMELSQFQPLNRPHSPVDISSDSQVVVESPMYYEALTVLMDIYALVESVVQLSQISALSSVQLSPNRVCEDYSFDILDVFPVFQVSPETDVYLHATSRQQIPGTYQLHRTHWPRVLCHWE